MARKAQAFEEILKEHPDECIGIPMIGETRSLNLSNSVAIVLYEALRQNNFDHMRLEGELHHRAGMTKSSGKAHIFAAIWALTAMIIVNTVDF